MNNLRLAKRKFEAEEAEKREGLEDEEFKLKVEALEVEMKHLMPAVLDESVMPGPNPNSLANRYKVLKALKQREMKRESLVAKQKVELERLAFEHRNKM